MGCRTDMSKTRLLAVDTFGHGLSVVESAQLSGQFEVVGFLAIRCLPAKRYRV